MITYPVHSWSQYSSQSFISFFQAALRRDLFPASLRVWASFVLTSEWRLREPFRSSMERSLRAPRSPSRSSSPTIPVTMQKPFLPWRPTLHPRLPGEPWEQLFIQPAGLGKRTVYHIVHCTSVLSPQQPSSVLQRGNQIHQAFTMYFYQENISESFQLSIPWSISRSGFQMGMGFS